MLPKSSFTGVLYGRPASVFAVLGYAIANAESADPGDRPFVDLRPDLLATTFACSTRDIEEALAVLCEKPVAYLRPVRGAPARYYVAHQVLEGWRREALRTYNRIAKRRSRQRLAQQGGA